MENINNIVLAELQEYAHLYFTAILEANMNDGKCSLTPGKYSAKEMSDHSYKSVFGRSYELPADPLFDEVVQINAGSFEFSFPYREIFSILAKWEKMMKAGKLKTVFEIGDVEIVSMKVLIDEKTESGVYREKRMKLRRLHGNWYSPARFKKSDYKADIYYKHDNVIFCGGQMDLNMLEDKNREKLITRLDGVEKSLTKLLLGLAERDEYFAEVCKRMDISEKPATPSEAPQISTESAETVNVSGEGETLEIKHISELIREKEEYIASIKNETLHTIKEADGKMHTYYLGRDLGADLSLSQVNHIPAATLAQEYAELKEMRDYMNYLNVIHISATEYYLSELRENIKAAKLKKREQMQPINNPDSLPQPPKFAPQDMIVSEAKLASIQKSVIRYFRTHPISPKLFNALQSNGGYLKFGSVLHGILSTINNANRVHKYRQRANKRQNSAIKYSLITHSIIFPQQGRCSAANSPPIGRHHRTLSTGSTNRIFN